MSSRKQAVSPRKKAAAEKLAMRTEFELAAAAANAQLNKRDLEFGIADQANSQNQKQLLETFGSLFSSSDSSPEEFTAAMAGRKSRNSGYDFTSGLVVEIRFQGRLSSAAVIVTKTIRKKRIVELIWFATHKSMRKQGYGDMLLRCIRDMAGHLSAVAILVESSDTALGWWISRRGVPVCTSIISTSDSTKMTQEAKWSTYVTDEIQSRLNSSTGTSSLGQFQVTGDAPDFLSLFYEDEQSGKPYRYKTSDANHVWIPVDTKKGKAREMWKHSISRQCSGTAGQWEYALATLVLKAPEEQAKKQAKMEGDTLAMCSSNSKAAFTTKLGLCLSKFTLLFWACCWVVALRISGPLEVPHQEAAAFSNPIKRN
jgi:hypothetical protein